MAYFNQAFHKIFIGSGAVKVTGHPKDLVAGQIALVNSKTNAIMASGSTKTDAPMVYVACGSYHTKDKITPFIGGYKESDKSKGVNPNYVSKWWVSSPTAAQNHILQLGWDGVSDCTVPSFEKDHMYYLRVEIKGSPVYRTMNRNFYRTYGVWTGCAGDACSDTCVDAADRKSVFDGWVSQINKDPIMSKFVKAYTGHLGDGDSANLPTGSVASNVYTYTVSDGGGVIDLAKLQTNYPTLTITRLSYTGITSVYQVIKTGSAPASFNSISWVDAGYDLFQIPRTVCLTIPSTLGGNGSTELTAVTTAYASLPNLVSGSVAIHQVSSVDAVGNCTVIIQLKQFSNNFVKLGCDYKEEATYDPIPSYNGITWEACDCAVTTDDITGKYFLRLEGAYADDTFSNCTFLPQDLYELAPVELQMDIVDETNDICEFEALKVRTIQQPKQATGTGEELLREYITYMAYKQDPYMYDPRMREALDVPIMNVVDRNKQYKKYYLLHNVPRWNNPTGMFDNDQYLLIFAFESGVSTSAFETLLNTYVVSGVNGVALETK